MNMKLPTIDELKGMSPAQVQALVAIFAQQRDQAVAAANVPIKYKVSEKGALSAYGLGRFPVTHYLSQWERLDHPDEVKRRQDFIKANRAQLKVKGE